MSESRIHCSNIINHNLKLVPDVGNVIPLDDILEILFGYVINDIPRMELLNKGFVVNIHENDPTLYFKVSKFEDFIKLSSNRVNFKNKQICPINFHNCLSVLSDESVEISSEYKRVFNLLSEFREFIKTKDDINSKVIMDLYWNDVFKGIVTNCNEMPFMLTIKFRKKNGYPFIMNITDVPSKMKNTVSINSIGSAQLDEFDNLYNEWLQNVLMENPDTYVITCLENITGSEDMAKFIFESHSKKSKFVINAEDLNSIINFSNVKKKKEYMELFKKIYANSFIFIEENNNLYLNFEGFNKYLLNLETSFLNNFEDKERINILYYNVMDELVNSYKSLYTFTKLI